MKWDGSSFWRQVNAVLSLYYMQWTFWAIAGICLFFVWIDQKSNQRHGETDIRYEINDDLKLHIGVIKKPIKRKLVVKRSMYSESEWEEYWAKLCASENQETIYLEPNWPEGKKRMTAQALSELIRFRAELQATGEYQGEIKLAISLEESGKGILGWYYLVVVLMIWGVSLSPLELPRVRLVPALIWPHLFVPAVMSLICFTYVLGSGYKPYYDVGAYLALSLFPFPLFSMVLIYKALRRHSLASVTRKNITSWCWSCVILFMFLDWLPTNIYQEFMFGQYQTMSWGAGVVSVVLLLAVVPVLYRLLVDAAEEESESEGLFAKKFSGANLGSDQNLLKLIRRYRDRATIRNRDRLLYMSDQGYFSFLSLLGYSIVIFLWVFAFSFGNNWVENKPIDVQRLLFFPMMFVCLWLCVWGIRGVVPAMLTKAGYATIPMCKREVRKVVFGGIIRRYLPWYLLLSGLISGWIWWGPEFRIQSLIYNLSANFSLLALMLATVAVGLCISLSQNKLEVHHGLVMIFIAIVGVIVPFNLMDHYRWDLRSCQFHVMVGLEFFIPSVLYIWYAWHQWLEVEWGYIPESNGIFD